MGQHRPSPRPHAIVVGGGIAGLAAAHDLASGHDVTLLEAAASCGGKLRTGTLAGRRVDLGPDAFITRDRAAIELCTEIDADSSLVPPSASGAALFARRRLWRLPEGLVLGAPSDLGALVRSGVLGPAALLRAALDLVLPGHAAPRGVGQPGRPDPTVAETIGRRLGRQVLDTLIDPLLGGINAGDVRSLSLASAAPSLAADLAGRRSVLRALRRPAAVSSGPLFLGVEGGMAQLVRRLTEACSRRGVEIVTGAAVERLERAAGGGRWWVAARSGDLDADAVVLALPAFCAAPLLERLAPALASELSAIPYAGVVTTTLSYDEAAVPLTTTQRLARAISTPAGTGPLPGNGVLVERGGGLVTAFSFTSTKWPRAANPGQVVVRASAGRHRDERALELADEALEAAVRGELATVLGITAAPASLVIERFPAAFPQYVSGHAARVTRIEQLAAALPGLALAGAAFHGIGIPACVRSGRRAAARLASVSDAPASA